MNCNKCGKNIPETLNYCPNCKIIKRSHDSDNSIGINETEVKEKMSNEIKQNVFSHNIKIFAYLLIISIIAYYIAALGALSSAVNGGGLINFYYAPKIVIIISTAILINQIANIFAGKKKATKTYYKNKSIILTIIIAIFILSKYYIHSSANLYWDIIGNPNATGRLNNEIFSKSFYEILVSVFLILTHSLFRFLKK